MSNKAPVLVGMDCGSGNVATIMEKDGKMQVRLTPSYVRYLPGVLKETESRNSWVTIGSDGSEATYAVQSKAINAVDTRTKDYQLSAACRVLVVNALAGLGLSGQKVIIADTLPADQFYDDNNAVNRAHIELKRQSLLTAVKNANKDIASPIIVDVRIMPEAVTAFNAALYTESGDVEPRLDGVRDVVIVDIGRYTINYAHLDCETQDTYARETTDQGAHVF
ncbi:plasmid segregation protein ParM [Pantoea sp. LMR881]|nr:plasmid segregation protein ParM domain-containing protein [Pantoea sp. LMR881]MCZ4061299.1 plasmid segregation protein ParM [Pantoea sp. LMR881]